MRAALSALRGLGESRLIAVFQPHLYSRTKAFGEEFGAALALADEAVVLDVYPAREQPVGELEGVDGLLVARAAADRMGGRPVVWAPTLELAREALERRLGPGRVIVTVGAGDVFTRRRGAGRGRGRGVSAPPPEGVERDYPLARLTTVRTGGPADWFGRPASEAQLLELLAWAEGEGLAVGVVGSGSNLLVADEGFRGLAIKLDGELAAIERDGERLLCGGGARLPSAAAKAAGWGLSGLEFGINIPGTAGGAVKMNANAYGGQLAEVLEWVDVCTAAGTERRLPDELGFAYRSSTIGPGRGRRPRLLPALARRPGDGQGDPGGDARAPPRGAAVRDQDLRLDLQEPRGPAGRGQDRRAAARGRRLPGPAGRRARASPRSTPTSSRTRARRPPPTCWR